MGGDIPLCITEGGSGGYTCHFFFIRGTKTVDKSGPKKQGLGLDYVDLQFDITTDEIGNMAESDSLCIVQHDSEHMAGPSGP